MTTFLDTNILISLLSEDDKFHHWSVGQFEQCKLKGPTLISDIVYCEFSIGMASKEDADVAVNRFALERFSGNDDALFRAGRAYKMYRNNAGQKTNVLPDFIIGAIAEVSGAPLVTTNPKDFATYFPSVELIYPPD